ncbi:MAG TPA: 2TM domain-containing protein [Nocardioides sp.]|jgi:hypothetical protein|nr:2TM domain-containing protein [Nocardioides sp.]
MSESKMPDNTMPESLREQALQRIKKRRDFFPHLLMYAMVNTFLVVLWAMVSPDAFFWPIFPIVGWGVGLVMHAWDAFFRSEVTDADIDRELARMQHH